jgi:hypothetical protein
MVNRPDVSARWRRLLLVALLAPACYVTAPIKPSELVLLDGYHDGEPKGGTVSVLSPANQPTEIADHSQIFLELPEGTYGGRFKSIQVQDGLFYGMTEDGQMMQVPLGSVRAARVREPNRPAAGLARLLVGAGTVVLLGTGLFVYAMTHHQESR